MSRKARRWCPGTKIRYPDAELAERSRRGIVYRDAIRGRLKPDTRLVSYFCAACDAYHLGHERVDVPPAAANEGGPDGHLNRTVEAPSKLSPTEGLDTVNTVLATLDPLKPQEDATVAHDVANEHNAAAGADVQNQAQPAAELVTATAIPAGDPDYLDDVPRRPLRIRPVSIGHVREELLRLYRPPLRARGTYSMMKRAFNLLAELKATTTADLTEGLVAELIKSRPPDLSCRTIAQYLRCLRIIAKFCIHRGYLGESPFAFRGVSAWVRITPVEHRRYYTSDEVRRILDTMQEDVNSTDGWIQWRARRLLALTATYAYGGFRASEGARLWVEDIDLELGIITVSDRFGVKTIGSARLVPAPPKLRAILQDWLPHRMDAPPGYLDEEALKCPFAFPNVTRSNYWYDGPTAQKPINRLKAVALRAGVEDATFARFRHAWATQAEFLGIPGAGIQRILGHTTELTSLRNYRHSIAKNLTDTVAGFEY